MPELINPLLSRRQLLTALALSPLLLKMGNAQAATIDPQRIVALEWLPVELMLALGIKPYAMADIKNYQAWVGEPKLPDGIIEVGLRTEPNLELLTQLKPSLILYSAGYGPQPEKMARIAPGLGFSFNDGSGKPLTVARQSLIELGEKLGMQQAARDHLQKFDQFIEQMKPRFAARGEKPVLLMTLLDSRHALVIGKNSLFQQVMDLLGVKNAWSGETNFWGSAVVGLERLAEVKDADVICFDHNNDAEMERVMATPLWKAMPFVRQQRFQRVPPVWLYGATLSAMSFTNTLAKAIGSDA
ncbi:periplasmic substrate-binding component of an ABC superfamily ferric hydroxamate transporter [Buttiauxella ferragutiae ATCC 51602]|jgi:iron complex transport system substrate-binding protein|uniref:Periplasmic substrate-binding component of an ABC superfamily ferric hydroxamate transporter n=1 Tax=Buttiauxella ferragutiae ATCC 51602 TaxID=1354252 RepID=A0ABX2WDT8_9ENTR|nr:MULTISPECIES: Fe(3+)-hydroxamate ABC transporter substrate-binding protein FhuD [Buttiauxella]MCE0826516.1 Fe(3+)-hydroxamate ABC transporter substrate-binding protein FhuD [Buttiauxella ferragutiae]OAT33304.1 periplasmic substrate-binding component of an ABC superfamily ferric hydroxamate transporter [Buttiauxella ferragutiae ATCC 51602]TDN48016.1 iron complex transport system substrate-binding protein [Buttiauxella sp. JUb87]